MTFAAVSKIFLLVCIFRLPDDQTSKREPNFEIYSNAHKTKGRVNVPLGTLRYSTRHSIHESDLTQQSQDLHESENMELE